MNEFLTADRSSSTQHWNKTIEEVCIPHLYASFGTFCVQIGQLLAARWVFKHSEINYIFFRCQRFVDFQTYFKDSLWLEWFTNLGAKGAKRSVNMWTTNLFKSFSKNISLYMNGRLSKIRSVHTYVMRRIF